MAIEIRQTIVTPDDGGEVVQLHISDVALGDEAATFRLLLLAKLPPLQTSLLGHLQREAMKMAQDALTPILRQIAAEIQESGFPLEPRRKGGTT